jgi:hypothetical protein
MRDLFFLLFAPVIELTDQTRILIGHQRNFIVLWGATGFRNYKHILQTSLDGQWIDSGEFPLALGSYATIPKARRGGVIDRTYYSCFLDIVHLDIAFGDCVSVGGFRYALILVDRATCYNWVYGLKDLS